MPQNSLYEIYWRTANQITLHNILVKIYDLYMIVKSFTKLSLLIMPSDFDK